MKKPSKRDLKKLAQEQDELAKRIAAEWDAGFVNMMAGKPLTEQQKRAMRIMPAIPWGDAMLVVNPDAEPTEWMVNRFKK